MFSILQYLENHFGSWLVLMGVAFVLVIVVLRSIRTIGPTEVGLVRKRFSAQEASRRQRRSPSMARPATRPSC